MHVSLKNADPAVWSLLEQLASPQDGERCYCRLAPGSGCPCDVGDCDGCQRCPTGRARSIIALEEEEAEDLAPAVSRAELLSHVEGAHELLCGCSSGTNCGAPHLWAVVRRAKGQPVV